MTANLHSKVYLGNSLELLKSLPDHSHDACITDPPYNMSKKKGLGWAFSKHVTMQADWDNFEEGSYEAFCKEWLTEVTRIVKPNGNILVFGTFHNIYTLGAMLKAMDRKFLNSIVWNKPNAQPNITCRMLTESTEQILWVCNETARNASHWTFHYAEAKKMNDGKQLRNMWNIPVTKKSERVAAHPTQKPFALMERLVLLFTNPGDRVLDPFGGVGTTGAACVSHGRSVTLMERDSRYFEATRARLEPLGCKVEYISDKPQVAPNPGLTDLTV